MQLGTVVLHLFTPHHTNNHRPKALHIDALLVYVVLFLAFQFGIKTIHREFPDILGYATDIRVEALLASTNTKRSESGLAPLALNPQLSAAAAQKAADMFAKNYWAHNSPTGTTPWDFIISSGYRYTVAGENLAKNFSTSGSVVDAWMASATHRANILKGSYKEVGFAVVNGVLNGEETTLVVQMFGTPSRPVSQVSPERTEVSPVAAETSVPPAGAPELAVASAFSSVTKKPIVNIPTVSREVGFAFIAIIMGILVLDAWLVAHRKTVRVVGHNIAHLFFFAAMLVATTAMGRGSLL